MNTEDITLRRFRQTLAAALDEHRPDRYVVSDSTQEADEFHGEDAEGIDWIDAVCDEHASLLPETEVRRLLSRREGHRLEQSALRRGNRTIRDAWESEQADLDWLDRANYPVTIVHRLVREGERPRVRRERVRVAAMGSADMRLWAVEERRVAARDFATRNRTCEAAESTADEMDEWGCRTWQEWAERKFGCEASMAEA